MKVIKAYTENDHGSDPAAVVPSDDPIATQDQQWCSSITDKANPSALLDRLVGVASNQKLSLDKSKQERLEKQ